MGEYKYTSSNKDINIIKYALKTCIFGEGLKIMCDINIIQKDNDMSTIVFTTKDKDKEIDPMEWFVFGIILGRDYMIG